MSSESDLNAALAAAIVPEIGVPLRDVGKIRRADVDGDLAIVEIELGYPKMASGSGDGARKTSALAS